jgi:MFS family permease
MKNEAGTAFKIIATLSFVYVASNFFRSSTAVIAPNIMDDLALTHEQLGIVGGIFFIAFAIFQVPVGIFLDRYGPKKTICGLMLISVLGSFGFALASNFLELSTARFFIGVGCAPVLMGSLVIISRWLPANRFAFYASLIVGLGGLGNIFSTTPTAWLTDFAGWRNVFWVAGGFTAISLIFGFLIIKDAPAGHPFHDRKMESIKDTLKGVLDIIKDREFQYVFAINLVIYGVVMTIVGLWGSHFLHDIYGLDLTERGNILLWMILAMIGGSIGYGYLDGIFKSRKRLVITAAMLTVGLLIVLAVIPVVSVWLISALLILLCWIGSYGVVIMSHGRAIFPEHLLGRGIATLNTAVFLGVFLMQAMGGFIIGQFVHDDGSAPLIAYRALFFSIAAVLFIAVLIFSLSKDSKSA